MPATIMLLESSLDDEEELIHSGEEKSSLVQSDTSDTHFVAVGYPKWLLPSARLLAFSVAAFAVGSLVGASAQGYLRGHRAGGAGVPPLEEEISTYNTIPDAVQKKLDTTTINSTLGKGLYPSLSDLVRGDEIVGDVSWELDFAVVGFPKSGTSFLMRYLSRSEETYVHDHELCSLSFNSPTALAKMYHNISRVNKDGRRVKVGLKCPKDTESEHGLRHYTSYFPRTDFIVTTRHPVLWFQSFYNFRSYQHYPNRMPNPLDLIGPCREGSAYVCSHKVTAKEECEKQNVCTHRSKFHYPLSRFKKTPMTSKREKELLKGNGMDPANGLSGRVFIMELGQLVQKGDAAAKFASDISDFLGLEQRLPDLYENKNRRNKYKDEERKQDFIDICQEKYRPLREELIKDGKDASEWIRDYFLQSDQVFVSQKDSFLDMIAKWAVDPCNASEG